MRYNWLFSIDLDGVSSYVFPMESFILNSWGSHSIPQFGSFVYNSLYYSRHLNQRNSIAIQEAFSCISNLASALLFWGSNVSRSTLCRGISVLEGGLKPASFKSLMPVKHIHSCSYGLLGPTVLADGKLHTTKILGMFLNFMAGHFSQEVGTVLSLAAVLVPPFDNISSKLVAVPLESTEVQMQERVIERPYEVGRNESRSLWSDLEQKQHAVEPRTGIEFL